MKKTFIADYLASCGIMLSREAAAALQEKAEATEFSLFAAGGYDYMVDYFLDDSDQIGYGITPTNDILNTVSIGAIAIALVEGDDVICIDIADKSVFLWLVQTGDGEKTLIAKNIEQFLGMI